MPQTVKPYYDESDIKHSSFQALPLNLQKSIKKIIIDVNFIKYEVNVKDLNTKGDNFMGKLYEVDIKGMTNESEKEVHIFIKERINLKMTFMNSNQLYANEEFMYKELSKVINNLQNQANIPQEDRFKVAKAYDETSKDAIILENLCKRGFRRFDKNESAPLKFFELGVQELAKMHGISFVIEKKMPEYFKEKITALDTVFHFNEDWNGLMRKVFTHAASLFEDKTKNKIESLIPVWLEKIQKYHTDKTVRCALCHGDYKKNNLMARAIDGEPVELIALDFQAIQYGCPIMDLILFLFNSSSREFRREHLNNLKDLYFETLSRYLQYFEMDVEVELPRQKFEQIYSEWLDYGFTMNFFYSVSLIVPDTGVDFKTISLNEVPYHPNKEHEKMIREMFEDFIEWGYL